MFTRITKVASEAAQKIFKQNGKWPTGIKPAFLDLANALKSGHFSFSG